MLTEMNYFLHFSDYEMSLNQTFIEIWASKFKSFSFINGYDPTDWSLRITLPKFLSKILSTAANIPAHIGRTS